MPNEFIARNGIISRGNLVVSGSVISTSPASFSGSLTVTGILTANSSSTIQGPLTVGFGGVVGGRSITANGNTIHNGGTGIYANGYAYGVMGNQTMVGNWSGQPNAAGIHGTGEIGVYGSGSIAGFSGPSAFFTVLTGDSRVSARSNTSLVQIQGSGTTSSTTALLVQNANASASFSIKDNGDSTFFYPGIAGYSLKISGSYSGNGTSAIYETAGASGGYYGIHDFRVGTNTANAVRAMSIVYGGRVVIGNKSDTVLQSPGANLLIDTNVINTFSSQSFNTGIVINPSGTLDTRFTASGIQFNFAANSPNDTNGGVFVGSQYNPATNGYDSDLVIFNSQGNAGSYVETARFVGKSKSLSLGAGRNPSASLHISGAAATPLFRVSNPASVDFTIQSDSTLTDYTGLYWGTDYKFVSKQSATLFINIGNNISFANGFAAKTTMNSSGQLGVGVTSAASILATTHVKGSGTTSSTTSLLVQNSSGTQILSVADDSTLTVGTTSNNSGALLFQWPRAGVNGIFYGDNYSTIYGSITLDRGTGEMRTFTGTTYFPTFYSSGAEAMRIATTRNVLIGTTIDPGYRLNVSGSGNFTNNLTVTGSFTVTTGSLIEFQVNQTGVKIGNATTDSHAVTGSVSISSSFSTSGSALTVYKSGSSVLDIQGSQGQLFSVIDALSGSLMSVNDVSGLPILEVFSDDRVVMGTYGAPGLTVSGSLATVATGSSAPAGTAPEGTFRFAVVGGLYYIYAYIGGAWRSGSLT